MEGGRWHSHVKYLLVKLRKNEVSSRALCAAIVCFLTHVDRRQEGPAASHRTVKPDKCSGTRAVATSPTAVVLLGGRREGAVQGRLAGPYLVGRYHVFGTCARVTPRDASQRGQRGLPYVAL